MALDGAFLNAIRLELSAAVGASADKIYQPYRDQLIIHLRSREGNKKLLLTCKSDSARIHFTQFNYENPPQPPMLCMLLRKILIGAHLDRVWQQDRLERVLFLRFSGRDELGDPQVTTIAAEIMGRHSNVIFIDKSGLVIDALKRVDDTVSSVRPIYPGIIYTDPPAQQKLSFTGGNAKAAVTRILADNPGVRVEKALLDNLEGLGPINCRQLKYLCSGEEETACRDLNEKQVSVLVSELEKVAKTVTDGECRPTVVYDGDGIPVDFSFMPLPECAGATKVFSGVSELLDEFYYTKEHRQRQKQQSAELFKLAENLHERALRKLNGRRQDLEETKKSDLYRQYGDYINANLYNIRKGDTTLNAASFEDPETTVTVPLKNNLSANANAQRYYKLYRKATTAAAGLRALIADSEAEVKYMESVLYTLEHTEDTADIAAVRDELISQGYIRARGPAKKQSERPAPPRKYSCGGFEILVGRNNRCNDRLTFKLADGNDIWLHARNVPGSHVIIRCGKTQPTDEVITYAATLAATYSANGKSAQVAVDYTCVKRVKKPAGSRPGFVNYFDFKTAVVNPDPALQAAEKQ